MRDKTGTGFGTRVIAGDGDETDEVRDKIADGVVGEAADGIWDGA